MKKEIEVTVPLDLNTAQVVALDTHSFLNIMNVLSFELFHFGELSDEEARMDCLIDELMTSAKALSDPQQAYQCISHFPNQIAAVETAVFSIMENNNALQKRRDLIESIANLKSILTILQQRVAEIVRRANGPLARTQYPIAELTENYTSMLGAIEKNSKGRFGIIYNIAAQQTKDYYVDFKIQSHESPLIQMPAAFVDVMRDLIANARKYTQPGGRINAGIWSDPNGLVLSVEDSGCGIPENEIEHVVGFGVRGSNVSEKRTMGAGLGLTKAYYLTKKMHGRMWIISEEDQGTRIKIALPSHP
jgi:signal transduction histidine kinase